MAAVDTFSRAEFYRRSAEWLRERASQYDLEEIKQRFETVARAYEAYAAQSDSKLVRTR